MKIYTAIHNFCVSHNSSQLGRYSNTLSGASGVNVSRGAQLLGADIYARLDAYLRSHLQQLLDRGAKYADEGLIQYYTRIWDRYTTGARYLNHVFDYINRHWIKRERDEGRKDIHDVNTLCLVRWKSVLFDRIQERLVNAIIAQIAKQRCGEEIVSVNIQKALQSFVSLGLDESNTRKTNMGVYEQYFEAPFVEATRAFYKTESETFLVNHSVVEYIKKASQRLQEELDRVHMYLNPATETALMRTCDEVLVSNHAQTIQGEFGVLLAEDRRDDFHLLFKLLSRVDGLLTPIQEAFQAYVQKQGLAAVDKLVAESGAANGDAKSIGSVDPKAYVETLLSVQAKYAEIVRTAFESKPGLVKALDNGCRAFINANAIAMPGAANGTTGGASAKARDSRTPELLARYSDQLLKKSSKAPEEADIDEALNGIMTVFQYIDSKDAFEKYYKRLLSKRLVNNSSSSEDAETNMVAKLKEACGYEYTNKLQRMFQDMATSNEMIQEFKSTLGRDGNDLNLDFSAYVLAENFWPLPDFKSTFKMPAELHPVYDRFQGFFNTKHSGRKLKWLWNITKGEVRASFAKSSKIGYTFQVSAYQLAILLPYNTADSYTYEQLKEITGLQDDYLTNSLVYLLKAKVLLQNPPEAKSSDPNTSFALNFDFKNKKVRINLNLPLKTEQKQEVEQTQKSLEEDRKLFLQAVIVRIMKARKELKHVSLVQETIEQSRKRFQPKVSEIKKSIDSLVDKEYLERMEDNKYRYLA